MKACQGRNLALHVLPLGMAVLMTWQTMAADADIDGVPLPDDIGIVRAAESATDPSKRFLGAWVGAWDDQLKHVLIVETVGADGTAQLITAIGDSPAANITRRWARTTGVVSGDTLTVASSATSTYTLAASGTLTAVFQDGARRSNARLAKIALDALIRPGATIAWSKRTVGFIDTALVEDGKPVRLEVVVFKPDGAGPFPLVVINHGSTGRGNDPRLFKQTFWSFAVAEFFTRKGWLVAFPQRRGRGNSDGLYDEGFDADHRAYSCLPDRSLPGAERALEDVHAALTVLRQRPDVDARRVVMGGISRGGVLSIAYAGRHPDAVLGVVNFVGGWLGTGCGTAGEVNGALFRQGAAFAGPTIWLYGQGDRFYSIDHSRANFATFESAGGKGAFVEFAVPGGNGHGVNAYPELWSPHAERLMTLIEAAERR